MYTGPTAVGQDVLHDTGGDYTTGSTCSARHLLPEGVRSQCLPPADLSVRHVRGLVSERRNRWRRHRYRGRDDLRDRLRPRERRRHRGTVRAAASAAPLPKINIRVVDAAGGSAASALTGADGTYTATALPAGTYYLLREPVHRPPGSDLQRHRLRIDLSARHGWNTGDRRLRNGASGIDFSLDSGGTISGKVTAQASGLPLSGIQVSLFDSLGVKVAGAATSASGGYRSRRLCIRDDR